jgi:putative methionine-R-sulfoxide reductase with GAF domain
MQDNTPPPGPANLPSEQSDTSLPTIIGRICDICQTEYGCVDPRLTQLFDDVAALYDGRWPAFAACQVGYHNLRHALDVALATARMAGGWNRVNPDKRLPEQIFLAGIAAALLHDAGYLKEKNDNRGRGGKYSYTHVARGVSLARGYLAAAGWGEDATLYVCRIIDTTEFGEDPELRVFPDREHLVMAQMVASADLIAQMADINYIRRLHDLYNELLEAYDSEGREQLRRRGIRVFASFREMLGATPEFYANFILPRLQLFNRMDRYLVAFFADGRNPYFENITANLSGQLLSNRVQWQRLGDILQELGLLDADTLHAALTRQASGKTAGTRDTATPAGEITVPQLRDWLRSGIAGQTTRLGSILMEMQAVEPRALRTGLLSQLLPDQLTRRLSRDELLTLLQIALLAQNLYDDPWVFGQIIDMTVKLLQSQSGSLLLADPRQNEMVVAIHCGPHKALIEGRSIPIDKGLAGWVYRHARAAFVLKSVAGDPFWENAYPGGEEIHSILAVPLHINGEIIGVAEVLNKTQGDFNDHDADLLTLLANVMTCSLALVKKLLLKSPLQNE